MFRSVIGTALMLLPSASALAQSAGNALSFDGNDDFVLIPHSASLDFADDSEATFELWLNPTSGPVIIHAFGKRGSCGASLADLNYQLANDAINDLHFATANCIVGNLSLPRDVWSHVAITSDGTKTVLYLNGSLRRQANCTMGGRNTADLKIGASSTCSSLFLGAIDEVRIWNVARSPTEIASSLDSGLDLPVPGLVGYWKFDGAVGEQIVMDSSPSVNDGTLGQNGTASSDDPTRVVSSAPAHEGVFIFADGVESMDTSIWALQQPPP